MQFPLYNHEICFLGFPVDNHIISLCPIPAVRSFYSKQTLIKYPYTCIGNPNICIGNPNICIRNITPQYKEFKCKLAKIPEL